MDKDLPGMCSADLSGIMLIRVGLLTTHIARTATAVWQQTGIFLCASRCLQSACWWLLACLLQQLQALQAVLCNDEELLPALCLVLLHSSAL